MLGQLDDLALVVEEAKSRQLVLISLMAASHGGALVSKIHEQTRHGDPFVRNFMDRILEEASLDFD